MGRSVLMTKRQLQTNALILSAGSTPTSLQNKKNLNTSRKNWRESVTQLSPSCTSHLEVRHHQALEACQTSVAVLEELDKEAVDLPLKKLTKFLSLIKSYFVLHKVSSF